MILFAETHLGPGIVAHEMAHAVIRWTARRRLSPAAIFRSVRSGDGSPSASSANEQFCDALERLVHAFWQQYCARRGRR